eukprot:174579-Karenia_brevis.AAC.1
MMMIKTTPMTTLAAMMMRMTKETVDDDELLLSVCFLPPRLIMALDSLPVFQAKLRDLKLDGLWEHFEARGWNSVATFAFSANYVPGNPDDSAFTNEVVIELLGNDAHPLKPALRRLFFDCYTMVAADAQRKAVG